MKYIRQEKKFSECMKEAKNSGTELNLLLGNGFSIGLHKQFHYDSLIQKIDNEDLKKLFEKLGTSDFEKVMERIDNNDPKVLNILTSSNTISKEEIIKEAFLKAIQEIHPETLASIESNNKAKAEKFLENFNKIFTTNYDLMLYWILIHPHMQQKNLDELRKQHCPIQPSEISKEITTADNASTKFRLYDGFIKINNIPIWKKRNNHNMLYLHGALHFHHCICTNSKKLWKELTKDSYILAKKRLTEQLKKHLDKGEWPMIVLEVTSEQKEHAINNHPYLKHCLTSLKSITGNLFIHGSSFNKRDKHIYDAIFKNKNIKAIFTSIHNNEHKIITENINNIISDYETSDIECITQKVFYYPANSINI